MVPHFNLVGQLRLHHEGTVFISDCLTDAHWLRVEPHLGDRTACKPLGSGHNRLTRADQEHAVGVYSHG